MKRDTTILIVDDEPNVRLVFRTALESTGYRIVEATDGEEALSTLETSSPDLVILDLQMPRLNGMATLRQIREMEIEIPVVIVTAHGRVPDAVEAMRLGAIDFLSKPLTPDELRKVVSEVIDRHAPGRAISGPREAETEIITKEARFYDNMTRAKRALNRRSFAEADVYLKQAIGLEPHSADAHNLKGVLHELRNEHDASYREYRAALKADRCHEPARHNMMRYYERFTYGRSAIPLDNGER
jgi:DNA-binding NtrC family response regulator